MLVQLSDNLRKTLRAPEVAERFAKEGVDVVASTPEEFSRHIKSELQKWSTLARERGMKAE